MRKTKVPVAQQVPRFNAPTFNQIAQTQRDLYEKYVKGKGYATGGFVNGQQIVSYSGSISSTDSVSAVMARQQTNIQSLAMLSNKAMFGLACIVLGLDTPEARAQFKIYFNNIDSYWTDEQIYTYMIEKAYEVKYGVPYTA